MRGGELAQLSSGNAVDAPSPKFGSVTRGLLLVYSAGLAVALAATLPWWARELRHGGKYREGLGERLGRVPRARLGDAPGQGVIWIHAVSVGEVLAVAPLVAALRAARPGGRVVVSTTTRTGQALARARFGAEAVFYFPADWAFAVRAWLRFLKPDLVVLAESEFWPRFLYEADRARVPVAVVNARVSSRSWPRYWRLRRLWRPLLGSLALVLAQTSEDAERLRSLGAQQVRVGGNLKYDLPPARRTELVALLERALPAGVPAIVCGSTLAGEEELLLQALPPGAVVVLAPRHPERFAEVAGLLARGARPWCRVSSWRARPQVTAPGTVLLLDSIGELAGMYAVATVALVGGGFLHPGGHNPLEPAALGRPVVVGPGFVNFKEIVETLRAAKAVLMAEPDALGEQVGRLLEQPEEAAAMGERAHAVCREHEGATARAAAALLQLVRE